jgi:hypothetical protein
MRGGQRAEPKRQAMESGKGKTRFGRDLPDDRRLWMAALGMSPSGSEAS